MKNLAWLEIDLSNLKENIRNLKGLLKPSTKFMAVVKSNGYGHGITKCAEAAITAGADWLGVVNLGEAVSLRQNGILKPVLVLGEIDSGDLRMAANQDISATIISKEKAHQISEINFDKPLKVHLKIDTGLNRLGLENEEIDEVVKILSSNKNIIISGIYSHLASVEENNLIYARTQIKNFENATKILKSILKTKVLKHIAASAAIMVLKESQFDMVRAGIAIYGLWPSAEIKKTFDRSDFLKPVLSYKTQIVQIKKVKKNEKIGYGCSFVAMESMTIGIIPIGYYEGLDRKLSNSGEVLISGQRCPIVGRVCMNMTIVDITNIRNPKVGDEVVIIGRQGSSEITVDEIAEKLNTINYEVVASLPAHLPRISEG